MSKMILVTASDLYQMRYALSTVMTARSAADVYDIKHMTLAKIEKLLYGDDAPPPTAPEPDMFWLQGAEETPAVGMPLRIAEEIQADLGIGVGIVECAVRLPDRKMRVWTEENEDGDEVTKWEWVSE